MLPKTWFSGAVLALATVSSAFTLEDLHIDGVNHYLRHGKRQDAEGTGAASSPAPPASSPPPVSQPSQPPVSTPPPVASPSPQPQPQSSSNDNNNNNPSLSQQPSNDVPANTPTATTTGSNGSNNNNNNNNNNNSNNGPTSTERTTGNGPAITSPPSTIRTAPITRTSDLLSTTLREFTTTIVTMSGNQQITQTSTGTSTSVATTGQVTFTEAPTEQQGNNQASDGGISDSDKKVIGGVVGGVGGALLLGGIALVFWRMKKRQARVQADDDDLMAGTGAALGDKPQNSPGSAPYQSNMDQYSSPGGRPNAAANF